MELRPVQQAASPPDPSIGGSPPSAPATIDPMANVSALRSLIQAIDRRDNYTRLQGERATELSLRIATAAGLLPEDLVVLSIAGPFHDVGKIVIADDILRNVGPLPIDDRDRMDEHASVGAAIVAALTDSPGVVALVRHHHEWFNGRGYPAGLRGEEITIATRVFAIADAYTAMTADRPYRRALDGDHAIAEVCSGMGTQFDPELVRIFERVMVQEWERTARVA